MRRRRAPRTTAESAKATRRIPRLRWTTFQVLPGLAVALINLAPTARQWSRSGQRSVTCELSRVRRWRHDHRTRRVGSRKADVALKRGFARWREIHDVQGTQLRARVRRLNGRITEHGVVADHRGPRTRHHDDALGVARHDVLIEGVARGGANDADTEIVGRIRETVATCVIQPDPAVVSGDSNTAAGRGGRSVANSRNAFNQCPKRVGADEHARTAIRGRRETL